MPQANRSDMNKDKSVLDAVDILNYSASLVEKFGKSEFSNGETLAAALTVDGIPFWDVLSAEFAHSHIPTVLGSDPLSESIIHRIMPYMSRLKHATRDFVQHRHNTNGCSSWPDGKTILFLGFTPQMYRDILQPVIARMVMHNDCHVVVLGDQQWPITTAENCSYQTIWQHWDAQAGKLVSKMHKSIDLAEEHSQLSNTLANIIPDSERHLLPNFKNLFNRLFRVILPRIVPHAAVARHILETHCPTLVIASDTADSRVRVYSVLCRLMNIPYLDIQFGLAGDEAVEWRFLAADCVAVWGDTSKEALLKQKVPEERIIITGSPRYDCLANLSESEAKSKRAFLGVPEKSALVVLASTYFLKNHDKYSDPETFQAMRHAIFEAADTTPNVFLIVKPHPLENESETRALFEKSQNIIVVDRQSDIRELIKICDAFISFGSTATIDALIAGKLTICPIFPGWQFSDLFKNSGATLVPESEEEIMSIFQMVSNGSHHTIKSGLEPARQDFLKRYVYRADGMAAARIEALALKMAGIGRK